MGLEPLRVCDRGVPLRVLLVGLGLLACIQVSNCLGLLHWPFNNQNRALGYILL